MSLRKSTTFLSVIALLSLALTGLLIHGRHSVRSAGPVPAARAALVRQLQLTDLCVFTEARYTRNPAVTDMASAFQDSPAALEHFPSGTLMPPPPHVTGPSR